MLKIDVLDHGYIELQDLIPNNNNGSFVFQHVTNAARTSYLGESKGYDADLKLLKYLWNHQHMTPFEMVRFQFRVKCPLVVQNQWVRHRVGSFNIMSYRYVEVGEGEEFYIPEYWRLQDTKNKQGSIPSTETSVADLVCGENLKHILDASMKYYNAAIELGVAREMARFFLPSYLLYSRMVWSVDLRNLIHFINLRSAENAQYEIRQYALALKTILRSVSVEIYNVVFGED